MPHHPFATRRWPQAAASGLHARKYSLTLAIIIAAHIGWVGVEGRSAVLLAPVLTLLLYMIGFILMRDHSRLSRIMLFVGLGGLVLSGINMAVGGTFCLAAALTGHATFLFLLIVFMLERLFREKTVTLDQIMAGIIIYLLMAGLWTQFYSLALLVDPKALSMTGGFGDRPFLTIYYFSVTTLTTAGFGDIIPVSDMARILAAYEALLGQVYLVVFIAPLMGRHFANR